jgi:hypothetical protein
MNINLFVDDNARENVFKQIEDYNKKKENPNFAEDLVNQLKRSNGAGI